MLFNQIVGVTKLSEFNNHVLHIIVIQKYLISFLAVEKYFRNFKNSKGLGMYYCYNDIFIYSVNILTKTTRIRHISIFFISLEKIRFFFSHAY